MNMSQPSSFSLVEGCFLAVVTIVDRIETLVVCLYKDNIDVSIDCLARSTSLIIIESKVKDMAQEGHIPHEAVLLVSRR